MAKMRKAMTGMMAANTEKRLESYKDLTNLLGENGNNLDWSGCMGATETMKVFQNLKGDLTSQNEGEVFEAAGICIHLLANPSFLTHVDASGQKSLCDILIKILKTSKNRKIINLVLQSLAKSRLKKEAYLSDIQENFDVLRNILQMKDAPPPLVCEALQVIVTVFNASPDTSIEHGILWFPSAFSKMFHTNLKVRRSALAVTSKVGETIDKMSNPSIRSDLITTVLLDLRDKYCKDMVRMVVSGNIDILQVWREIVVLLGTELHSRRHLINCLLNVVEKAFKIADPEVRVESFITWRTIIDNFALDKNTLTNQKKLQLLLAPFKISNARTEDACNTKLHVWWHLVSLLADKRHLVANFDQAVVPLLNFCFIGGLPSEGNKGGLSNRNLIMSGALSSPRRAFSSLHTTHAEVLAQILATDSNITKYKFALPVIKEHIMSSALFMRHYPLLLKCFAEAVQTLRFNNEQQNSLGIHIFSSLLVHVRTVTAPDVQKKEVVDLVRELFNTLSHIENLCHPGDSQSQFLFKFFSLLTMGNLALPKKVLNSHQYHIPVSGSGDAQDIMCGTLSTHLITQLCRPALLHHSLSGNEFMRVWTMVLENSQPVTGKLRFLQAVIQELSTSAIPFLCPGQPFILCHLWNAVLKQTLAHIGQEASTSECDDSEPDWSCIYSVLHFPVIHATEAFTCAPFDIFQQIMETWKKLWNKFTLVTSTTPTVEPNSEVEHVASTLLTLCQEKTSDVPDVHIAFYVITTEMLVLLTENFQYDKLGKAAEELSPSPAKAKKKPHPLHNLASTIELTIEVFEKMCSMVSGRRMYSTEKLCQAVLSMIKGIQKASMRYIQEFITHIVKMLLKCVRVNPAVVFDFKVEKKCISMLKGFTGLVKMYITQKRATESILEHLNVLEPLFSAAFTSTNKKVKQEVRKLIEDSIASINAACLDVPPFLLEVQTKWDILPPKSASVNDPESMEDFIQATPNEKRTAKSVLRLSNGKTSTPSCNVTLSTRKQKAQQSDKNEKCSEAVPTPPTRCSVRVRKVDLRSGKNHTGIASPTPSTPSTPEDSFSRVAVSTTSSDSAVKRVMRTYRNMSPKKREGKHPLSQSTSSESEGKEENPVGGNTNIESIKPIIISSSESEKTAKDWDKASHINSTNTDVEAERNTQRKSQNLKTERNLRSSSVNHSKENEDSDCSELLWQSEQSSVYPDSRMQDKGHKGEVKTQKVSKETLEKTNEGLCAVLEDTSREVQKLLEERHPDEENEEPTHSMKKNPERAFTPNNKSQTATNQASEETSENDSAFKRKRINFMEVNVSPSIIKDAKLAAQRPKVKITNDEINVETPQTTVLASDSDDEIFEFPELGKPVLENSVSVPETSDSDKKQMKEVLPHKPIAEKQTDGMAPESSTSGEKRKRKLFSGQEEVVESSTKRRKKESTTQNHTSSLDSIIELGTSNSEEISTKNSEEIPKTLRKTRSHSGQTDTEKEEKSKTMSAFSPKVTRSGRKIVPPNKDMPEPMTPPKKSKKKLYQKGDSSQAEGSDRSSTNTVNLCNSTTSSLDETGESLSTEAVSVFEGEVKVDHSSAEKVSVSENESKKCEQIGNETSEGEFDCDTSVTILGTFDASTSTEKSLSLKSKMKETENLKTSSSNIQRDSIEEVDITDNDDFPGEDKESSHVFDETNLEKDESSSSVISKSKLDEPALDEEEQPPQEPASEEEEEEQPQGISEEEKRMDLSDDSLDPQKISEESTPMECGQDLDGEVSYPAARRGTDVLDDSASAEVENHHEDEGGVPHANKDGAEMELMCVEDNEERETEVKDITVPQDKSNEDNEEEEEEDKSSCGEDDPVEEMERTDTPASPEPEEEEEEEDYLSAGQEKAEEKKGEQEEVQEKTKIADVSKMQQEPPDDGMQESEKSVPVNLQEQENLERTDNASDKNKLGSEFNSSEIAKLSQSEKITIADIKESELQEMDTSFTENKEDQRRDCTSGKEVEIMNEGNTTISEDVMIVEDANGALVKVQEELHRTHTKKCEQQHTIPDKTQHELQEDNVKISSNVQESMEAKDTLPTTKDSDEMDKNMADSSVCGNTIIKEESLHIASSSKHLPSEKVNILEMVTSEKESLDTLRKETQANLTSESMIGEIAETVSSPNKNVEVKKALVSSEGIPDTNVTVFSPRRSFEVKETVPVSGKDDKVNQTFSSPRKTVNIETVSSPGKTVNIERVSSPRKNVTVSSPKKNVEVKVPIPRKTIHMKEMTTIIKSDDDRETACSPRKPVVATETVIDTPGRTDGKPETSSDVNILEVKEDDPDPKALQSQHTERTADTAPEATRTTSVSIETLEEPAISTRQQEEELSPDKSSRSRLKLTVSTPERMKQRGAIMHAGSRAALLVACAKQNIKNRGGGEGESSANVLTEGGRSRSLGSSPVRRSVPGRPSPAHSPDSRRKSLLDSVGMKPWVKHTPSPGASPSTSILKRTLLTDGLDGDTPSPPPTKYRRVSFADPPVSDRVEIPPSPRTLKGIRAQKRLDMTRMASEVKDSDIQQGEKQVSQEADPEELDMNKPLCPALLTCQDKVEQVAQHLTSPAMLPGLIVSLEHMGIATVGQLCKLTEWDINSLPIKAPKVTNTRRVLKEFEKTWRRENSPINSPVMDEVEVTLAKMFGELDDKENLKPNHQDCAAPEVTKAETEVRESGGRSSHSDNIQEIMDMEDITPLYSSLEETEEETLKNLYRRASEDDLESQKKLLHHLLQTMPSSDVADAIAQCIKMRMADVTATT